MDGGFFGFVAGFFPGGDAPVGEDPGAYPADAGAPAPAPSTMGNIANLGTGAALHYRAADSALANANIAVFCGNETGAEAYMGLHDAMMEIALCEAEADAAAVAAASAAAVAAGQ